MTAPTEAPPLSDVDLADLFVLDASLDEVKCEAQNHESVTCSVKVTHLFRYRCRPRRALICENAAKFFSDLIRHPNNACMTCGQPVTKCWRIIPV